LIFQDYNLVEPSPVLSNVLAGRLGHTPGLKSLLGLFSREDVALAQACLEQVGLGELKYRRARDLSGGQKQRVAIARALVQEPSLVLADEPVASLDPPTAEDIMGWFARINRERGVTVLINLHDIALAKRWCRRLVGLKEGRLVWDGPAAEVNGTVFREIFGRMPVVGELGSHAAAVS
jgi:phosphonate transport system ATP-binding protein